MFCSDKCGSAYWKLHGTTHTHKDLPHFNCKDCEQCGNQFWYNDYAERGGKRTPKFCSSRCRTRHFRAHPTSSSFAGTQYKARPFKTGDFRDSLHEPTRWNVQLAFTWIGLSMAVPQRAVHMHIRALNGLYHPDKNGGKEWPYLKIINAAWDYLKRNYYK